MVRNLVSKTSATIAGLLALAGCSMPNADVEVRQKPKFYLTYLEEYCDKNESDDSYDKVGVLIENESQISHVTSYIVANKTKDCKVNIFQGSLPGVKDGDIYEGHKIIRYFPNPSNQGPKDNSGIKIIPFKNPRVV